MRTDLSHLLPNLHILPDCLILGHTAAQMFSTLPACTRQAIFTLYSMFYAKSTPIHGAAGISCKTVEYVFTNKSLTKATFISSKILKRVLMGILFKLKVTFKF